MENSEKCSARKIATVIFFTLFCNFFFFHRFGSLAFVILGFAFYVLLAGLFLTKKYWQEAKVTVCGFSSILIISLILLAIRAQEFVNTILILFNLGLLLVFSYLSSAKIPFLRSLTELLFIPLRSLLAYLKGSFSALNYLLAKKDGKNLKSLHLQSLLIGLVIAIPITLILISIFSSADPIYAAFARKIINLEFLRKLLSEQIFQRLFFSLLIFIIALPLVFLKIKSSFSSPIRKLDRFSLIHEAEVVMVLVALTIFTFLVFQWQYIFASVPAETDLSRFGVATYSEYVQKGFGELLGAAVFIFSLVWGGLIILRSKRNDQKTILPYMQMIVLFELFIFIISVFRRIILYQTFHGLSLVRIYGALFLVWIMGLIITLAVRHFRRKSFILAEAVFTAAIILFIGFFNAEDFIVRISPPTVNDRVDYVYLSKMSSDGLSGWQKALNYAENTFINLEEKPFLNQDERREIAYAGFVARKVLENYHSFVHQFGTVEEVNTYYQKILSLDLQYVSETLNYLEKQYQQSDLSDSEKFNLNLAIYEYRSRKSRIEDILQESEKEKEKEKLFALYPRSIHLREDFYDNAQYSICEDIVDVLIINKDATCWLFCNPSKRLTGFDKLFARNVSREKAFQYLQNDSGLERLLDLQMRYLQFYKKIAGQPEGERDFEVDISLKTPFLE